MAGTCQSVKEVLQSVYRTAINQFPRFENFTHVLKTFTVYYSIYNDISYQENSGSIARC